VECLASSPPSAPVEVSASGSPNSLKQIESICTRSWNLYVSQHTNTGMLWLCAIIPTTAQPVCDEADEVWHNPPESEVKNRTGRSDLNTRNRSKHTDATDHSAVTQTRIRAHKHFGDSFDDVSQRACKDVGAGDAERHQPPQQLPPFEFGP
jgi:hypothetical protein